MGRIKLFEDFCETSNVNKKNSDIYKAGDKVSLEIEPGFIDNGVVVKRNDDGTLEVKWEDNSISKNVKPADVQSAFNKEIKEEVTTPFSDDDNDAEIELDIELSPEDEESMIDTDDDEEIEESKDPSLVTSKDTMRITDIMRKAEGNMFKAKKLAQQMANAITDSFKAARREYAAVEEHQPELAKIFRQRAIELGSHGG